jgi:ATP-binding cassette subfamily B protein
VDSRTEKQILGNLTKELTGRTALIITHRIFTLLQFDKIIVMEDGKIVEEGNHEDLMSLDGIYREMYEKQRSGETLLND